MKSQTETVEMQRVALDPVEARVLRLRNLNEHMITRYLELAVALHEEHESQLWAKATPTGGGHYIDEEEFWEEAIGIKRRTAYQLIAVGGVLAQVLEKEEATEALTQPSGADDLRLD